MLLPLVAAHRVRSASQAERTLWAAVLLAMAPAIAAAQGTSTAPIRYSSLDNQVVATYSHDGIPDSAFAGTMITVARQAALSLAGSTTAMMAPGQRRVFTHLLTNRGGTDDLVSLVATTSAGWTVALYKDVDGNGQLSAGDTPINGPVYLTVNASIPLLAELDVPAVAPIGSTGDVTISATSSADSRASVTTMDRVTVIAKPLPDLRLTKSVDRTSATLGDTLHYNITFSNAGDGDAQKVTIVDTLPRGLRYAAGSLRLGATVLTDAADADAGAADTLPDGRGIVRLTVGALVSQASGTLQFSAVVSSLLYPTIANVAVLAAGDSTRTFVSSAPDAAVTRVSNAMLGLTDRLVGTPILMAGARVHLRFTYTNTATVDAHNAVLTDTLPAVLSVVTPDGGVVSSTGGATPQPIISWAIGTLAPGASGVHDIYLQVVATPAAGTVSDRATVTADNAATQFAGISANVALFTSTDLRITKTAAVLEAAIGDAVPYTVVVRNAGIATLAGVIVHDRLPDGMRYSLGSLSGADSATVSGQDLSLYVGAPLLAGTSHAVRYAAVIATPLAGAPLENRAMAEAEFGLVLSDTASVVVTQRRTLAMRERNMIGKVWLDRNNDGVQQGGEEGVSGVQVWDANGDVAVTDKEGRFSFRNVATGTHALRLDPLGIPKNFLLPSRADEVIMVLADGWSLPSTSIRLVPRAVVQTACGCSPVESAATAPTVIQAGAPVTPVASIPAVVTPVAAPMLAPLVSAEDRARALRRELIEGPGTHIVAPADGSVLPTPRFFAGVHGVPGARVRLYDGATLLRDGVLRGDGAADFVNVELAAGPHHLRAVTGDSTTDMHSDSLLVHISGAPAHFVMPAEQPTLRRDATEPVAMRVLVLDRWNVPVANHSMITVTPRGATVAAPDEDGSSVGMQLSVDPSGYLTIPLRAGHEIGSGDVSLAAGTAKGSTSVRIFASVRPLMVTGVGQVGAGGAPESFGALTVQGAVSQNTAVTLTYDSRRGSDNSDFFQRGYDPLGDEQFPTVGDHSTSRTSAPTNRALSARVEHGMDWVAAGDVQTNDFGRTGELGAYRRSLTGVNARIGTGDLVWHAFGSMTQQSVERSQLRGDGSSGPYLVGGNIRQGTETIALETRARDNAARIVSHQQLVRVTDYQIDYSSGTVLLRVPVPATDAYGNPVFVIATVERLSGGAAHFVGGLRMDADAARFLRLGSGVLDSLTIGLSDIRDEGASTGASLGNSATKTLLNADVHMGRGSLTLGANVLRSQTADTVGTATSATGRWAPSDAIALDGRWMSTSEGLGSVDPRLASAFTETSFGLTTKLSATNNVRLHRDESHFMQYGITRSTTGVTAEQQVQGHKVRQDLALTSESGGTSGESSVVTARISTEVTNRIETWVDGTHSLIAPVAGVSGGRPNQMGTGITLQLPAGLKLDASHRVMHTPGDSIAYGVTSAELRADGFLGGQVWTGFEESVAGLHDEVRAGHSALLGWNQKLDVGAGWHVTSLFERRIGLSRASLAEPARALPFVQAEKDRWSAAAGLGWIPGGDRARLAFNAEMQNSQGVTSSRFQLTGDAALNAGLAVIALNDWSGRSDATINQGKESRQDRSLLGFAMRPVTTNRFNALAKLEWRRTIGAAGNAQLNMLGHNERLIGTTDAVWTPARGTELSARYALRITSNDVTGDSAQSLRLGNHFAGARLDQRLIGALHLRADGRMLMETQSGTALWNAAPSVLYDVQGRLTLEAGYRFGALRDPDFAAVGGSGAFATAGFRFTEGSLASPAAFWRERIANDR